MKLAKLTSIVRRYHVAELVLSVVLTTAGAMSTSAHEFKAGNIQIFHPWARATPDGAKVGAGYMRLTNKGTQTDRLIGGSTTIADRLEIHDMKIDNGIMRMRRLPKGLLLPAGKTVELKPSSFHVMFTPLTRQLKKGNPFKATLTFENAGQVEVEFKVEAIGAAPPKTAGSNADHDQHKH